MFPKLRQIEIDEICIGHGGPFRMEVQQGILPRPADWSTGKFGRMGNFKAWRAGVGMGARWVPEP
jgi:hypothetical protein